MILRFFKLWMILKQNSREMGGGQQDKNIYKVKRGFFLQLS